MMNENDDNEAFAMLPERLQRKIERGKHAGNAEGGRVEMGVFMKPFSLEATAVIWPVLAMQSVYGSVVDDGEQLLESLLDPKMPEHNEKVLSVWREEVRPKMERVPGEVDKLRFIVPSKVLDFYAWSTWFMMGEAGQLEFAKGLKEHLGR